MIMNVKNYSFRHDLTIGNLVKRVFVIVARGPSDSQMMFPGGECLAPVSQDFQDVVRIVVVCDLKIGMLKCVPWRSQDPDVGWHEFQHNSS